MGLHIGKSHLHGFPTIFFGGILQSKPPLRMLLSMEISPSGLNLTVAHHVILAQPTVRGEDDEAVRKPGTRGRSPKEHQVLYPRMDGL